MYLKCPAVGEKFCKTKHHKFTAFLVKKKTDKQTKIRKRVNKNRYIYEFIKKKTDFGSNAQKSEFRRKNRYSQMVDTLNIRKRSLIILQITAL